MKFLLASSLLATTALAASTSTATAYDMTTTEATITSCSHEACTLKTTEEAASSSSTGAPILAAEAKTSTAYETDITTTLVTVTSCKDNACATTVAAAAVSLITSTVNAVETVYTTYCPLTATESSSTAPGTLAAADVTPSSSDSNVYVDVDVTVDASSDVTEYQDVTAYVSADEATTYADVTVTPTDTSITNVEATSSVGSTFTSVYSSAPIVQAVAASSSSASNGTYSVAEYEGAAQRLQNPYLAVGVIAAVVLGL